MPMRFPYLKAARVKLQERKNSCIRSSYESAEKYIGFFLDFVRTDPRPGAVRWCRPHCPRRFVSHPAREVAERLCAEVDEAKRGDGASNLAAAR